MTAGWGATEVPLDVSSRRLALVLHRHLAEHGLLSFLSLLGAFQLNVIKRNQANRDNLFQPVKRRCCLGVSSRPPAPGLETEQTTSRAVVASFDRSLLPRVLHMSRLGITQLDPNQRKVKFTVSFFSLFMCHPHIIKVGCKRRN